MPRQNILFVILTPLVLMAFIAVIVVVIGETLLATHHWAEHYYHVTDYAPGTPERRYWREIAALPAVGVAMGISTLFLVGGMVASKLAPQVEQQGHH